MAKPRAVEAPQAASSRRSTALRLHPRPLLPAAPRKPLARNRRSPGLRRPLPRLERPHHRRVLRPQRSLPHHQQAGRNHPHHEQLRADQLQLRPHPPQLAPRQSPPHLPHDPRRRQVQRAALQRTRLRHGPGLQPPHHAAGEQARRPHSNPLGHRRLRVPLRPQTRRHVARRDRRQSQRPRPHGAGGHQVHRPRPRTVRSRKKNRSR